jgi:hypothetical protein
MTTATTSREPSFRQSVDLMFNRAAALLDLPPGLEEKIRVCNATYTVRFGVRLRGEIRTFTGYRSVHSEHMEPVKGGIRLRAHGQPGRGRGAGRADDLQMRAGGGAVRRLQGRGCASIRAITNRTRSRRSPGASPMS